MQSHIAKLEKMIFFIFAAIEILIIITSQVIIHRIRRKFIYRFVLIITRINQIWSPKLIQVPTFI